MSTSRLRSTRFIGWLVNRSSWGRIRLNRIRPTVVRTCASRSSPASASHAWTTTSTGSWSATLAAVWRTAEASPSSRSLEMRLENSMPRAPSSYAMIASSSSAKARTSFLPRVGRASIVR